MLMRRLAVTVLLTVAASLLPATTSHAAVPRDFVGLVTDDVFAGTPEYRTQTLAAQQAIGVGLIRRTFDWSHIELAPGQYDFSAYDSYVAATARHGVKILPVLFNPPAFKSSKPATGAKHGTYFPKRVADLGAFGKAVVERYGRKGTFWAQHPDVPKMPMTAFQVWNEPNIPAYAPPKPSARKYVAMLKATRRGIRSADPKAEIVTAGLPDSRLSQPDLYRFIAAMYKAGAKGQFNSLAINPYARTTKDMLGKLRRIRKIMRRAGDRNARIWVTEIGWSDVGPKGAFRVGATGQASRIKSTLPALARARGSLRLRGVVYFSWRDGLPYAPRFRDFWGLHTGLLRHDGSAKPALAAFRQAVAGL